MPFVNSLAHVSGEAKRFGVLDDFTVFPAQVVSHEVNNKNIWACFNRGRFQSIDLFLAAAAGILVFTREPVSADELIQTVLDRDVPLNSWDLKRQ